jgi:hypothetical protein
MPNDAGAANLLKWLDRNSPTDAHVVRGMLAEIQRLRAALEPFARLQIHPAAPDDGLVVVSDLAGGIVDTGPACRMTVRDIRRAAAVFGPVEQTGDAK